MVKSSAIEHAIAIAAINAIFSIENPASIKMPNNAVPKAVAKTIKAVGNAFIDQIYFTP